MSGARKVIGMKTKFGASCFAILTALGAAACSGQIGDDLGSPGSGLNPTGGGGTMGGAGGSGADACIPNASLAPARISRITDQQYVNIVRDVFGVAYTGDVTTVQATNGEYQVDESAQVSSDKVVQAYLTAADQVAANIHPCGTNPVTATCLQTYLAEKLPLAWRRPVTSDEMTGLMAIFTSVVATDPVDRALKLTIEAALGHPAFIYRSEFGTDASAAPALSQVNLTGPELATAVSFALTNTVPDAQLWARALDNSILKPDTLAAEVDRLMATTTARDNLKSKLSYLLNFEKLPLAQKDPKVFPEFTDSVKTGLYQSAQMLLEEIMSNGKFGELLTTRRFYANQELATVYKIPGVTGPQLVPVDLQGDAYSAGILTHPALLASSNQHAGSDDIVHRGLWVYNNLVCGIAIGAPPAGATDIFKTITGTERERARKRDAMGACGACHANFDPFGLMTEDYDPIGRHRAIDPETMGPIDTSATIKGLDELNGVVSGVRQVAAKLQAGRRAADCAVDRLAKFTLDHNPEVENSCEIHRVMDEFVTTGSLGTLFRSLVTSPAFLTRQIGKPAGQ